MALTRTVSDYKDSVKAATVGANINLAAAPNTLDGVSLAVGDRILVKDQSPNTLNGIYRVTTLGTGSNGTWTRTGDFNDWRTITSGALTFVEQGAISGNIFYYIPGGEPNVAVGSTAITFANLYTLIDTTAPLQSVTNYGNTTTNGITISNAVQSGSSTSGALIVTGGAGIGGNLYVGGNLVVTGNITTTNYETISQTEYANSIVASGNVTAGGFKWTNGNVYGGYFTVSEINAANAVANLVSNVTTLRFDSATGFKVYDWGNNTAKIALGSSFATWYVAGQGNLKAVGEDTAQFIAGSGISITTNNTATPQSITFSSTYSNSNVSAYLPTYTGALSPSSITTNTGGQITGYHTGAIGANGGNTGAFTTITAGTIGNSGATLTGTLSTAAQTNITSVGTLTGLTSTGTIAAPTVIGGTIGNAGAVLYGTLNSQSASQTNITSVGTLTGLVTSGNITSQTANLYAAYVVANSGLSGTLITNAQTNITSVGTLGSLTVSGTTNLQGTTNGATINATNLYATTIGNTAAAINGNLINGSAVYAGTIGNTGTTLTGTLSTAAQTNITSTGALTSPSFTTSSGGQLTGYHTGAIGANAANSGAFTTLTASGNTTLNNYANIYIATGSTASTSALSIIGNIYGQGGTGYLDFLKLTNTYSAGTNPNKYFRLNPTGGLEVVNSAYTQVIFILSDTGSITIPTTATATVGNLVTTNGVYWPNGSVYSSGGSGSPGGASTQIQFNNGGSFGGATSLQYISASGNLVSSSTTASTNNTTGAIVVSGGIGVGGNVTADIVHATNNGNGTNFQIGDDLWLGDINVANTARVMGQQDNTQGYIVFGSTNATNYIGRSGSNPITVTGAFNVTGTTNLQGTTNGTTINATTIQGGTIGNSGATLTGTLSTAAQTNITSVGILTGLVSSANITAQTANVYAAYVVANSGLSGTLITNAQTNITSTGSLTSPSFTTSGGGQITGYHTGAIGANTANTGSFTTITTTGNATIGSNSWIIANNFTTTAGTNGNILLDPDGGGDVVLSAATTLYLLDNTATNSTTSGTLISSGGAGIAGNVYVGGNIYTQQRTGYTYSGNSTSVAYTYYNAATGSLDTVFG